MTTAEYEVECKVMDAEYERRAKEIDSALLSREDRSDAHDRLDRWLERATDRLDARYMAATPEHVCRVCGDESGADGLCAFCADVGNPHPVA